MTIRVTMLSIALLVSRLIGTVHADPPTDPLLPDVPHVESEAPTPPVLPMPSKSKRIVGGYTLKIGPDGEVEIKDLSGTPMDLGGLPERIVENLDVGEGRIRLMMDRVLGVQRRRGNHPNEDRTSQFEELKKQFEAVEESANALADDRSDDAKGLDAASFEALQGRLQQLGKTIDALVDAPETSVDIDEEVETFFGDPQVLVKPLDGSAFTRTFPLGNSFADDLASIIQEATGRVDAEVRDRLRDAIGQSEQKVDAMDSLRRRRIFRPSDSEETLSDRISDVLERLSDQVSSIQEDQAELRRRLDTMMDVPETTSERSR
ncbi:MAG: hypothetical protein AAGJ40_09945 [Planctomycetota bacterium]